jgi:hypothetical protein
MLDAINLLPETSEPYPTKQQGGKINNKCDRSNI